MSQGEGVAERCRVARGEARQGVSKRGARKGAVGSVVHGQREWKSGMSKMIVDPQACRR